MKEPIKQKMNMHWNSVQAALGKSQKPVADVPEQAEPAAITIVPIDALCPFPDHPFKVTEDGAMDQLVESIRENGILSPILVRPVEGTDEYEIISGHRRCRAAQLIGLETVPVIVTELTRDEAVIRMVDSNLHREHLLPSEKAFAYKMKLEAPFI